MKHEKNSIKKSITKESKILIGQISQEDLDWVSPIQEYDDSEEEDYSVVAQKNYLAREESIDKKIKDIQSRLLSYDVEQLIIDELPSGIKEAVLRIDTILTDSPIMPFDEAVILAGLRLSEYKIIEIRYPFLKDHFQKLALKQKEKTLARITDIAGSLEDKNNDILITVAKSRYSELIQKKGDTSGDGNIESSLREMMERIQENNGKLSLVADFSKRTNQNNSRVIEVENETLQDNVLDRLIVNT